MTVAASNIGINCMKKDEIAQSLVIRRQMKIDPYRQGFNHNDYNLNQVRLCFQVFLTFENASDLPLKPVMSDIITNKKAAGDLNIIESSHDSASMEGGQKVLLFCERVSKDDVQICFSYTSTGIYRVHLLLIKSYYIFDKSR